MPRPVFGAAGSRDVDVAAKQKAWDAAQAERDGLREALEEMVSCFDPYAWGSPENKKDALQNARAAIAKEQSK